MEGEKEQLAKRVERLKKRVRPGLAPRAPAECQALAGTEECQRRLGRVGAPRRASNSTGPLADRDSPGTRPAPSRTWPRSLAVSLGSTVDRAGRIRGLSRGTARRSPDADGRLRRFPSRWRRSRVTSGCSKQRGSCEWKRSGKAFSRSRSRSRRTRCPRHSLRSSDERSGSSRRRRDARVPFEGAAGTRRGPQRCHPWAPRPALTGAGVAGTPCNLS